ncbi:purine-binding chemotaxis protein CheW [Sphingomonas gellani]|uniref:Purine-binding chemotaxis protein CheW n=1 Tax=Sphingomonas gellani TaxID=1166340 RepID=A0A1H7ZH49_9SPHN|nr:chemotaxis protein CheW [Sphingomonas gellani]SEM56737.1 purine-binding chemotaxis protein CheW [Sphingomonas gellani]
MTAGAEIQAVTFGLGDEIFAVRVACVREILDHAPAFRIPNGPDWLLGLTDVRGQGVPTIDFRAKLGLARVDPDMATRILIVDLPLPDRVLALGLVVDRVLNVTTFGSEQVEPAPDIGVRWRSDYIEGVMRQPDGFVVLVDLSRIFTSEDGAMLPTTMRQAA